MKIWYTLGGESIILTPSTGEKGLVLLVELAIMNVTLAHLFHCSKKQWWTK
jgi:hypothetical protein